MPGKKLCLNNCKQDTLNTGNFQTCVRRIVKKFNSGMELSFILAAPKKERSPVETADL
jgi:hypothetical protein